jgi:hypothetical protein
MSQPYFGGTPQNMGRVTALPAGDFAELVRDVIVARTCVLSISQAEMLALPEREQNERKRTDYLVPCAFKSSPSPRQTPQALDANLLCLDIDDSAEAARILNTGLDKLLGDLSAVVWHTARSTPDKPRLRVVVPTTPVPVARYGAAVTALAGVLGMSSVSRESLVPVQPMYLPVSYRGGQDPIAYQKVDGQPFDSATVEGIEELRQKAGASPDEADLANIDYLRAPVEEITRDEVVDALSKVTADCSMQQWVEVGMAIKHQFGDSGFSIWDDWSATAPSRYPSTEELAKRWESFVANPPDRVPVTIRSVVRIAVEAGWNNRPMCGRVFDSVRAWIRADARSSEELLDEGARRIAKVAGILGAIETKVLAADLHSTIRARGLRGPTQADVAKEVGKLRAAEARAAAVTPPWASNIVFLTAPNLFYRPIDRRKMRRDVVDLIYQSPVPDVSTSQYLVHEANIPVVEQLRYAPDQPKRVFLADGIPYINTYRATYPKADRRCLKEAAERIERHAKQLYGKWWRIAISFSAFMVQCPGKKIRWLLFVQSAPGAGKGTWAVINEYALGASNVQRLACENIMEPTFNGWATGYQLAIADEVRNIGINRYRITDRFKPIISDDVISIRNMYEPVQTVPNIMNWIMFSNYHDALAITPDDRRYCVVFSPLQTREQVLALGSYHDDLYQNLPRLAGGIRAFFEDWTFPSDWNPNGHAPRTEALAEMVALTASPLHRAVQEVLDDSPHALVSADLVSLQALRSSLPREGLNAYSDQALSSILRELGFTQAGRHIIDGNRHSLWAKPGVADPAATAQQRFDLI